MRAGRIFGHAVAADFIRNMTRQLVGPDLVPFLAEVEGIDEIYGYSWLLFNHVAARSLKSRFYSSEFAMKNMTPLASRTDFTRTRGQLSPAVQKFLSENGAEVTRRFVEALAKAIKGAGGKVPEEASDMLAEDGDYHNVTVAQYLETTLTGNVAGRGPVNQRDGIGMQDLDKLDTNEGAMRIPKSLYEYRSFFVSGYRQTPDEAQAVFEKVADVGRADGSLPRITPHASKEAIAFEVERIIQHPVSRVAPLLLFAQQAALRPSPQANPQLILSPMDANQIYRSLAKVAAGEAVDPALRAGLKKII
jgi:hypothetical protein